MLKAQDAPYLLLSSVFIFADDVMMVSRLELSMHPPHVFPPVSAKFAVQVVVSPVFPLLTWQAIVE